MGIRILSIYVDGAVTKLTIGLAALGMTSRWFQLLLWASFKQWGCFHWRFEYVLQLWCHFTEPEAKICKNTYLIVLLKSHLALAWYLNIKQSTSFSSTQLLSTVTQARMVGLMASIDETLLSSLIIHFFSSKIEVNLPMSSCFLQR